MATIGHFVQLVLSSQKLEGSLLPFAPHAVDVRDLARAHLLAISALPSAVLRKTKRLLISGANWSFVDAAKYLAETRPELKDRLSDVSLCQVPKAASLDTSLAEKVLGMDVFIDWKKTVDDMVDSVLKVEKDWESQSY